MPGAAEEIERLQEDELIEDVTNSVSQWRHNRLSLLYGRNFHIDYRMDPGTWKYMGPMARGGVGWLRFTGLPRAETLRDPNKMSMSLAPDVVDAVIERDCGDTLPHRLRQFFNDGGL